ncbi:MAG: guanylate kinase [Sedimentisphaerales bacterium]|nr:guanylate kinase [Sedimentisphaerales bacterium]
MSNNSSQEIPGQLVIISGPSGVGKSTICNLLVERLSNAYLSVSTTTRPQKAGEQDGVDYWFVSKEEFGKRLKADSFLEYAEVFGHMYGTEKDKVLAALEQGRIVLLEIDVQGALQVVKLCPEAKLIFILPPKQADLQARINDRGRDAKEDIETRLAGAGVEIAAAWQYYKYMVINDDLEQAVNEVVDIIAKPVGE